MDALPRIVAEGRWRLLALLVANGVGQAIAAIVAALAVERAFSLLTAAARPPATVASTGAVLVGAGIVTAGLRSRERVDAERLGQGYVHRVRLGLFARLTAMSPRSVQARSQGGTALRFVGDLNALRRWVSLGLARLVVAGTTAVGALVALAVLEPVLAAGAAVAVIGGGVATLVQGRGVRDADRQARRRRARVAANVTETIGSVGVVQVNGAVDRERRRVRRQSRKLREAMVDRAGHLGRLQATTELAASLAAASVVMTGLVAGVGAPRVAAATTLVSLLVPQLRDLGRVQEYWHGGHVAREAIGRFLLRPTMLTDPSAVGAVLPSGGGRLVLDGVEVDGSLRGVSAVAEPGTVIAVVGPNGAGKTTLLAVLARLLDPSGGRVLLDGVDLADLPIDEVRRAIGAVGPDLPLRRGSVARNLRYRVPDASDAEVAAVLDRCDLADVLNELPDGLATRVAEGGAGLSSGQRQRLLLARAVLGDPRLLLLDEADANLDGLTASVVDRVLASHLGTALVVTHRRERVASADLVWHVVGGDLVEVGPPTDVLRGDGPTARLFGPPVRAVG